MDTKTDAEGMLTPYRVLDLTDEKGLLCGKLLADLGADVIKIEPAHGDSSRRIGPYYQDDPHPEKSLFWFAYNTGKRGITLDLESAHGKETFRNLVQTADVVVESFPPGYMDGLGLGYAELEKLNPGVIMVSISPFGQTGPFRDYKAPDIVAWAMGGQMCLWGDPDRPPIRISHHSQAHLHGGAEAAVGALMALHHRNLTGQGQHVDVSIEESVAHVSSYFSAIWDMMHVNMPRGAGIRPKSQVKTRMMWPCKDGYVIWIYWGGLSVPWNLPIVEWMKDEGMADDFLGSFDWATLDYDTAEQETIDRLEAPTAKFFLSHTKAELWEGALKYRAQLYPVATAADAMESVQLAARGFWVQLEHPELGTRITYPGAFGHASVTPPRVTRRAPLIGEHNGQVLAEVALREGKPGAQPLQAVKPPSTVRSLEGVKVVDFGWNITIPLTAKLLSDCGALVIEIESEKRLDPLRTMGPFKDGESGLNRSGNFNIWNTCKLGLTLDLSQPKGVEVAKRLAAWADVVVENFAGGAMKRMGLGYEELRKVNPGLIMLSSCMQGQEGPYSKHPGTGHQLTGLAGFNHIAGWPDKDPPYLSSYTDFPAPRLNAVAILAALDYRRRTGKGQYLDMSQLETGLHFLAPILLDYNVNGRVANRMGNRHPGAAPHNAYRCAGTDRWCVIAVFTDREWEGFCKVLGSPPWTTDPRFATLDARKANEELLDKHVQDWTVAQPPEEVMRRLQEAGVPAGVVQNGQNMLEHDPQLKERGFFVPLDHPEVGTYWAPRPTFLLSKDPYALTRAPLMGEHNEYVLKEILGMSDDQVAELIIDGVLQ